MNRQRKLEIVELLAERVRQPREASELHPHSQVLPFDKASRDVLRARVANPHLGYNLRDSWWGVPPFVVLAVIAEQLYKLREVHVQTEGVAHSVLIEGEPISSELDLVAQTQGQVTNEAARALHRALADEVGSDQFGFRIHRYEHPLVADLVRVGIALHAALFLLNEGPDFVTLDVAATKIAEPCVQQGRTARPNGFQKSQDRVSIQAGESLGRADRAALDKTLNRPCRRVFAGSHRPKGRFRLRLAEGSFAGIAAPALDSTLAVGSEALAGLVLA